MVPINNIIHIPGENLRVIAIAPPDHLAGTAGEGVLMGADPASLYNACRYAAFKADHNIGAWGKSNWAASRKQRKNLVLLYYSLQDGIGHFKQTLLETRPHLIYGNREYLQFYDNEL